MRSDPHSVALWNSGRQRNSPRQGLACAWDGAFFCLLRLLGFNEGQIRFVLVKNAQEQGEVGVSAAPGLTRPPLTLTACSSNSVQGQMPSLGTSGSTNAGMSEVRIKDTELRTYFAHWAPCTC